MAKTECMAAINVSAQAASAMLEQAAEALTVLQMTIEEVRDARDDMRYYLNRLDNVLRDMPSVEQVLDTIDGALIGLNNIQCNASSIEEDENND